MTRSRLSLLCMLGAMILFGVWLFSPVGEVVSLSGKQIIAASGWTSFQDAVLLRATVSVSDEFSLSPKGSANSWWFWYLWRRAHYEILLVAGTAGIFLMPIFYRYRKTVPALVRRGTLLFFTLAALWMFYAMVEAYDMASDTTTGSPGGRIWVVHYGVWLPPVFFTLAFLSVLLGGARKDREEEGGRVTFEIEGGGE